MAKTNKKDFDNNVNDQVRAHNLLIELQQKELDGLSNIFSLESRRTKALLDLNQAENERGIRFQEYKKMVDDMNSKQIQVSKTTLTAIEKQLKKEQDHINKLKTKEKILRSIASIKFPDLLGQANAIGGMFNDKPIRETINQLGMGAEKGQAIRDSFYEALPLAAEMGLKMEDLAKAQQTYTEESGRALALSGKQLVQVGEIAKGTGLAVNEASQLAAQWELLGMDTSSTHETIMGIMDSTERMGVSIGKVLKNVAANFSKLNTFAFKDGVKGMGKMAAYAEKFKVSFDASINSAQQARTLEGAIEMAAQLNVLGGEFAKSDPFELFHLSRNDPAKYTQRLNEMTKGMSSLVKTADGFRINTTPQDLDRLKAAGEAMGIPFENLVQQSERFAEIQAMNKQLMGTMMSKEDREAVQAMAKLDSKSGIFKVLGKDIKNLTDADLKRLRTEQTTLKERADALQTWEEKWSNTVSGMKYTLIPILDGVNAVFDTLHPMIKAISGWMQKMPDWSKTGLAWVGGLAGAGIALGKAGSLLKSIPGIGMLGKLVSRGGAGSVAEKAGGSVSKSLSVKGGFGAGAGIGAAGLGIGAGVGVAAAGISKLADSMAKLNPQQVDALETIATTLAVAFPLAAVGVGILAAVAAPAAAPLLALGGAIAAIGAGIGLATAGIGYMAQGFGSLLQQADPSKIFKVAAGVTALGGAMAGLAGGGILATLGGGTALALLAGLSTRADQFGKIGDAFKQINVVLNSNKSNLEDLETTLKSIASIKVNSGGVFNEIKELMKNGIKVKFDEKQVNMVVNMSVELDSDVIARKTAKKIVRVTKNLSQGNGQ